MRIKSGRAVERAIKHYGRPKIRAARHRRELRPVVDRTGGIPRQGIVVFSVVRNEAPILPCFLDHYRKLGVAHFIFLDNESTDGTEELLAEHSDCSVWSATGSYKASGHGLAWLNHMMARYGTGRWCLALDADELLVYPFCDSRTLPELVAHLDQIGRRSLFTILLDLYPKGPLSAAQYTQGQDPLSVSPWFDAAGYRQVYDDGRQVVFVKGGVRRRVYFRDEPHRAPALNKLPLVKWRRHYAYDISTHALIPPRRNHAHLPDSLAVTGCLLHFKFFASILDKAKEEMERREHWDNGREYEAYLNESADGTDLWNEASVRYGDWRQLVDLGLMHVGGWA